MFSCLHACIVTPRATYRTTKENTHTVLLQILILHYNIIPFLESSFLSKVDIVVRNPIEIKRMGWSKQEV